MTRSPIATDRDQIGTTRVISHLAVDHLGRPRYESYAVYGGAHLISHRVGRVASLDGQEPHLKSND